MTVSVGARRRSEHQQASACHAVVAGNAAVLYLAGAWAAAEAEVLMDRWRLLEIELAKGLAKGLAKWPPVAAVAAAVAAFEL